MTFIGNYVRLNPNAKSFIPRKSRDYSESLLLERCYSKSYSNSCHFGISFYSRPSQSASTLNPNAKPFYPRMNLPRLNPNASPFFLYVPLNPNAAPFYPTHLVFDNEVTNNTDLNFDETSLLNISPSVHNFSTHSLSAFSDNDYNDNFGDDNLGENSIINTTPIARHISTPVLSEINLVECNAEKNAGDKISLIAGTPFISNLPMLIMNDSTSHMCTTPHIDRVKGECMTPIPDIYETLSQPNGFSVSLEKQFVEADETTYGNEESTNEDSDPFKILKNIRIKNVNRLTMGQLNINSIRNKFEALKSIVTGNLDILVITESKLDEGFPNGQFDMEGYSAPFRVDRNKHGGGVLIYVRDDITCRELKGHPPLNDLEGIFLELNLKKSKWFLFGGYNPNKENISYFVNALGPVIDHYMPKYDNFILLGDFNSEMGENAMSDFCDTYNLINLIKDPTCFKNPLNPSTIDLILTNRPRSFQNSLTIETGLSDHHKLTVTTMRSFFPKQVPTIITYRDYKQFDQALFRQELLDILYNMNSGTINYDTFEYICIELLRKHAPLKEKCLRANNQPFMNKTLAKAVMTRSRLRNKFLKNPSDINRTNYSKYRNYCTSLFRKEKKLYYNNLDMKSFTDNKKFWKTVKPLFSDKHFTSNKITLLESDEIISEEADVAKKFNDYFSNVVKNLEIEGFETEYCFSPDLDSISNIIEKFKYHPSILKIKENVQVEAKFHFTYINESEMMKQINSLEKNKPTTFNNIPTRILVENSDIISPFITDIYNESSSKSEFPNSLKLADLTPVHKKDERIMKENYRPVSILPPISKIFERNMQGQIEAYIDKYLSPFLFGFRRGFSTQQCLLVMLEKWHDAMDESKFAGALLTDLSKAFDCLNHELLIAKLEAYGFDLDSLTHIYSYLSNRKQRTKINRSFSDWSDITCGVPQGSILGPLLFNIYLNDIFFFTQTCDLANYADDTTPYSIESTMGNLLRSLFDDTSVLIKWFKNNYLQMNPDKCKLLISNHDKDIALIINNEVIECSKSVKLLGVIIDNKLDFKEHISKLCKKVSSKLHALARISNYMCQDKLRVLMKSFIESQFSYCPLVWMFHSRTLNNRINKLHERGLRLVYKDSQHTFEELLHKDQSFSIHHRNLQKLATEMYKAYNDLSPSLMQLIFPQRSIPYNLRNKNPFESTNVHTVYHGTETISYRGPKIWALVPEDIKCSKSLAEFKAKIRNWEPIGCTCRLCKIYIPNLGFI